MPKQERVGEDPRPRPRLRSCRWWCRSRTKLNTLRSGMAGSHARPWPPRSRRRDSRARDRPHSARPRRAADRRRDHVRAPAHVRPAGPLPRRARRARRAHLHDDQVPDAAARCGAAPRHNLGPALVERTEAEAQARPLAPCDPARRDPPVLERPHRRHEPGRPASDPPTLLRGAGRRPAGVLAALVVRPGLQGSPRCAAATRRRWPRSWRTTSRIADRSVRPYLRTLAATGWRVLRQSLRGLFKRSA